MATGTLPSIVGTKSWSATPNWTSPTTFDGDRDGFDLVWRQSELQTQMADLEAKIRDIEKNANLSDTERMFAMQMAHNAWSAIGTLRTNMLKGVSDCLKSIARNV